MALDAPHLTRWLELPRYYLGGIYKQLNEKPVFLWGQAIAFKVLVTIVPLVILATGVVGLLIRGEETFWSISGFIRNFLPAYQSDQLIRSLEQFGRAGGKITIIGAGGLIFAAMTLFTTLRIVIASVFSEEWHKDRTIIGGYLFDIRMAAQVSFLFLLSMGITAGIQTINSRGAGFLEGIGLDGVVSTGWHWIFDMLALLLPFLLSVAMFFQLFYFIPKPHPPKMSALWGAGITALMWELAKYAFTFYATSIGGYDRYSIEPAGGGVIDSIPAAVGNAFGLIIAFVFWVYYSGVVLCIGALFALMHEKRYRARRKREHIQQMQEEPPSDPAQAPPVNNGSLALEDRELEEAGSAEER